MKILICCGAYSWRPYSSQDSFIQAFRDIGHEVITCGPMCDNYGGDLLSSRDVKFYDRIHPELYTYDEVLEKINFKPDLILQMDPNFYLYGEKPKDIISAYYIVDVHRGASMFRELALRGNFNYIFIAQKYFMPIFEKVGLKCYWLPRAYDDTYIKDYNIEKNCDISFCGETGISDNIFKFNGFDKELGLKFHEGKFDDVPWEQRYRSWENHNLEYSCRAEILIRLSKDFNVRIYEKAYGPFYAKALQRGSIVFNHSVWKDSDLRNFEVLASNRLLITDWIPFQDDLLEPYVHYYPFEQYFLPYLDNFKLEFEFISDGVKYMLSGKYDYSNIIKNSRDHVEKFHTFKNRAKTVIDTINGRCNGYQSYKSN